MKKLFIFTILFFTTFTFLGCTQLFKSEKPRTSEATPDEVVKTFVELSASAKTTEDKKRLIQATGGEVKTAFERLSDEEFKLTYLSGQLKMEKFEILESRTEKDRARVRYRLTVENRQGTDTTHETNEREVDLLKGKEGWTIQAIRLQGTDKLAFTRGMIF